MSTSTSKTAEVAGVQVPQAAVRQVLERHVEALVHRAVARAHRAHVRLDRHQQHGVEPLGLAVAGVRLDLLRSGPPGQRPRRVGHDQGGGAVGVHQLTPRGRHPPEAVLERGHARFAPAVDADDGARATVQPGVVDVRPRHPAPLAGVRRREAQAPPVPTVPEGGPPQYLLATAEVGPHLDRGVRRDMGRLRRQPDLHLAPRRRGRRRRGHPAFPLGLGSDELLLRLREQLDDANSEAKVQLVRLTAGGARHQLLRGRGQEGAEGACPGGAASWRTPPRPTASPRSGWRRGARTA